MMSNRTLVLVAVLGGLAVLVYLDNKQDDVAATDPARPASSSAANTVAPGRRPGAAPPSPVLTRHPMADLKRSELRQTLARPLFQPNRRPLRPPSEVVRAPPKNTKKAEAALDIQLLGIVRGDSKAAAVVTPKNGKPQSLEEGDFVGDWEIVKIDPDGVTFANNGRQRRLQLKR